MKAQWTGVEVYGIPCIDCTVPLHSLKWDVPGVYAILWADGSTYEYVGQAKCLRTRLQSHEHAFVGCNFEILALSDDRRDMTDLDDRLLVEGEWITKLILSGHELINKCHYAQSARKKLSQLRR